MIAPTTVELEREIRSLVASGSGLLPDHVIPGNGDGPSPDGLYASVVLIHEDIDGIPSTSFEVDTDSRQLASVRGRYSVQWFRDGARDAARSLSVWTSSPEGLTQAARTGLTVMRVSDVRQLDDIVSDAWEERAGVDIDIGYVQQVTQTIGYVRTAPVEVQAGGQTQLVEVGNDP